MPVKLRIPQPTNQPKKQSENGDLNNPADKTNSDCSPGTFIVKGLPDGNDHRHQHPDANDEIKDFLSGDVFGHPHAPATRLTRIQGEGRSGNPAFRSVEPAPESNVELIHIQVKYWVNIGSRFAP